MKQNLQSPDQDQTRTDPSFGHVHQASAFRVCCSLCVHRAVLFQELLSRRTSIPLHNQELLYEGRRLNLDPNRQAKTFPQTSRDNPIMLVSRESVTTVGLIFEDRRSLPVSSQNL